MRVHARARACVCDCVCDCGVYVVCVCMQLACLFKAIRECHINTATCTAIMPNALGPMC